MVSGSFPLGLTFPVSTAAVPVPPVMPPCQMYITASGRISSIHFMSMMLPTFSSTAIFVNFARTRLSISISSAVSR